MVASNTRKMSARHEDDLVDLLGGTRTRNSGATWADQADGHQINQEGHYRFTWDGKSTLGKSIGVTVEMYAKLCEQARGLTPMLPLRWYRDNRLTKVDLDLIAVEAEVMRDLIADANAYHAMLDAGCASGTHDDETFEERQGGIPKCKACGLAPYERGNE